MTALTISSLPLAQFLDGSAEAHAIVENRNFTLYPRDEPSCICFLETAHFCYHLFLSALSYLLYGLCMQELSHRIWTLSCHEKNEALFFKVERTFRDNILARSINAHRQDSTDPLPFFFPHGICRGMSHWFIYLYFKTKNRFTDPVAHLRAVGQQFEWGAPAQAVFLHSQTPQPTRDLLHLSAQQDYMKISPHGKRAEEIVEDIRRVAPGVYGIYVSNHLMVYIKPDAAHHFLFDPTKATLNVTSPTFFQAAIQPYLNTHTSAQEILVDRYESSL